MKSSRSLLVLSGVVIAMMSSTSAFADLHVRENVRNCGDNQDCKIHVLTEALDGLDDYVDRTVNLNIQQNTQELNMQRERLQRLDQRVDHLDRDRGSPHHNDGSPHNNGGRFGSGWGDGGHS